MNAVILARRQRSPTLAGLRRLMYSTRDSTGSTVQSDSSLPGFTLLSGSRVVSTGDENGSVDDSSRVTGLVSLVGNCMSHAHIDRLKRDNLAMSALLKRAAREPLNAEER